MTARTKSLRVLVTGATGFLGHNVLTALTVRPDVALVAACRTPERLPAGFAGEVRSGDLRDPAYRRDVVADVDVVCHTGTWSAFWGHADQEQRLFYEPNRDLIEQSIRAGVRRFVQTSTVVMAAPRSDGAPVDDLAPTAYTGFWPHVDRLVEQPV